MCVEYGMAGRVYARIFIILDLYTYYVCANKNYNDVPMIYTLCHLAIHAHVLM